MLFDAVATALSQVPVRTLTQVRMCATCIVGRIAWENAHKADMNQAMREAAVAAGIDPADPQAGQADFGPFLPEHLQPGQRAGIPGVNQAVTTVQGTDVCHLHIPGVQPGRAPLLVANAAMSPGMLGQLARTG
jgi:hypothetical protein